MFRSRISSLVPVLLSGVLAACGSEPYFVAKPEPWRAEAEIACLRSGAFARNALVFERRALGGPKPCGAISPLKVFAMAGGAVTLEPAATLRCPMVPALDRWLRETVRPAARRHFGQEVVSLKVIASYGCRPRNNKRGARLSEHGYANALDVAGFTLASGRKITVLDGWRGGRAERAFLREVHRGACRVFTTVIGPNGDRYHRDHFHLDLARHNRRGTYRYCR